MELPSAFHPRIPAALGGKRPREDGGRGGMEDAGKRLLIRTSFAEALGAVTSEKRRGRQVGGSDHGLCP